MRQAYDYWQDQPEFASVELIVGRSGRLCFAHLSLYPAADRSAADARPRHARARRPARLRGSSFILQRPAPRARATAYRGAKCALSLALVQGGCTAVPDALEPRERGELKRLSSPALRLGARSRSNRWRGGCARLRLRPSRAPHATPGDALEACVLRTCATDGGTGPPRRVSR